MKTFTHLGILALSLSAGLLTQPASAQSQTLVATNDLQPTVKTNAIVVPTGGTWTRIVNVNSGLCLNVRDFSQDNGAQILQYYCNDDDNEKFMLVQAYPGNYNSPWRIVIKHSGRSVDVAAYGLNPGDPLQQWEYLGGPNQMFYVDGYNSQIPNNGFTIRPVSHPDYCLDMRDFSTEPGGVAQQWNCSGNTNQKWGAGF